LLPRFSAPGGVSDPAPDDWSARLAGVFGEFAAAFPQFYDPVSDDTPDDAKVASIVWSAFPASLEGSDEERLKSADGSRGVQDEYCEWTIEKNDVGKITRVTFTTEVPEYWEHLFENDRDELVELYQQLVDPEIDPAGLEQDGAYLPANQWNSSTQGRPAHLIQGSNSLGAAVKLAAEATILRMEDNGDPISDRMRLVECGGLGSPLRNSDPQIASAVNSAAASGAEITLSDPAGLYIDGLTTGGMATPDGANPADYWTIERGDPQHVVRAAYEVPEDRGYVVGDITIGGQPIDFGGQLAQRVRISLEATVKPGSHEPERQRCVS